MNKTLTGIFEKSVINIGSKSERTAILLNTSENKGVEVRLKGANTFDNSYLEPYVGQKVSVTGIEAAPRLLIIKAVDDITPVV